MAEEGAVPARWLEGSCKCGAQNLPCGQERPYVVAGRLGVVCTGGCIADALIWRPSFHADSIFSFWDLMID